MPATPGRTSQQIVNQTNELALQYYKMYGYVAPDGYRFDKAPHQREAMMWKLACRAQEMLTNTSPDDCLTDLDE